MSKIISWDFWDTLVTRAILKPEDLFKVIEKVKGIDDFYHKRINAEKKLLNNELIPSINEIYSEMDIENKKDTLLYEKKIETILSTPIKCNIKKVNKDDIITSDYYFDKNHLDEILIKLNINIKYENIFVS